MLNCFVDFIGYNLIFKVYVKSQNLICSLFLMFSVHGLLYSLGPTDFWRRNADDSFENLKENM